MPEIAVTTDIALDLYNANGHDGFKDGIIVNDEPSKRLLKWPLLRPKQVPIFWVHRYDGWTYSSYAWRFGADGHTNVAILSYAAKYASAYYGPFRDAVGIWRPERRQENISNGPRNLTRPCV